MAKGFRRSVVSLTSRISYHRRPNVSGLSSVLPPPNSPWDEAYESLRRTDTELVRKYEALLEIYNGNLHQITADICRKAHESTPTYRIADRDIVVTQPLAVFAGEVLSDLIDSAAEEYPEAMIVWAGVSMVIPFLSVPAKAREAIMDRFGDIVSRVQYHAVLNRFLSQSPRGSKNALRSAAKRDLTKLYEQVLRLVMSSVLRVFWNGIGAVDFASWLGSWHHRSPIVEFGWKDWFNARRVEIGATEGGLYNAIKELAATRADVMFPDAGPAYDGTPLQRLRWARDVDAVQQFDIWQGALVESWTGRKDQGYRQKYVEPPENSNSNK
jgi:hypothetical protein